MKLDAIESISAGRMCSEESSDLLAIGTIAFVTTDLLLVFKQITIRERS